MLFFSRRIFCSRQHRPWSNPPSFPLQKTTLVQTQQQHGSKLPNQDLQKYHIRLLPQHMNLDGKFRSEKVRPLPQSTSYDTHASVSDRAGKNILPAEVYSQNLVRVYTNPLFHRCIKKKNTTALIQKPTVVNCLAVHNKHKQSDRCPNWNRASYVNDWEGSRLHSTRSVLGVVQTVRLHRGLCGDRTRTDRGGPRCLLLAPGPRPIIGTALHSTYNSFQ